jgi:hypothetical protein
MKANGLINALAESVTDLEILRREPAANALVLEVSVEAIREILILGRVADEAGVELDGLVEE